MLVELNGFLTQLRCIDAVPIDGHYMNDGDLPLSEHHSTIPPFIQK